MTRDEIMNMPAGREMDVLICEMVMKWKRVRRRVDLDVHGFETLLIMPDGYELFILDEWDNEEATHFPDEGDTDKFILEYSTDISAAWEVVEKVYIHTLRRVVNDEPDKPALWQALAYDDLNKAGIGETAPLAICRAALIETL